MIYGGAAYIIGGGCSDDAFMDFRSWLISMGRDVYEKTLSNPDSLVEVELGPDPEETAFFEEFYSVAIQAYEQKAQEEMPSSETDETHETEGEMWEEDDDLKRLLPRLWAKYVGT